MRQAPVVDGHSMYHAPARRRSRLPAKNTIFAQAAQTWYKTYRKTQGMSRNPDDSSMGITWRRRHIHCMQISCPSFRTRQGRPCPRCCGSCASPEWCSPPARAARCRTALAGAREGSKISRVWYVDSIRPVKIAHKMPHSCRSARIMAASRTPDGHAGSAIIVPDTQLRFQAWIRPCMPARGASSQCENNITSSRNFPKLILFA